MAQILSEKVMSYLPLLTILLPFKNQVTEMGREPETLHSKSAEEPKTLFVSLSFLVKDGGMTRSVGGQYAISKTKYS